MHKIKIRLESNDPFVLDVGTADLARKINRLCKLTGPSPLHTKIDSYTVMRGQERSIHSVCTHRRMLIVNDPKTSKNDADDFFYFIKNYTVPNGIHITLIA